MVTTPAVELHFEFGAPVLPWLGSTFPHTEDWAITHLKGDRPRLAEDQGLDLHPLGIPNRNREGIGLDGDVEVPHSRLDSPSYLPKGKDWLGVGPLGIEGRCEGKLPFEIKGFEGDPDRLPTRRADVELGRGAPPADGCLLGFGPSGSRGERGEKGQNRGKERDRCPSGHWIVSQQGGGIGKGGEKNEQLEEGQQPLW